MFSIDGLEWTYPCGITRVSEIKYSDISGPLMNGNIFKDPLGTYLKYTVKLVAVPGDMDSYTAIFEAVNAPVGSHTFIFPYNQTTVTITAAVEQIRDVYKRLPGGAVYWEGIEFDAVSVSPVKSPSLSGAIAAGMPPTPTVASPTDGDTYTWNATDGEWEEAEELPDADEMEF